MFQSRSFNQLKSAFISVFNKSDLTSLSASSFNSNLRSIKMLVKDKCFKCEQSDHLIMNCFRLNKFIQNKIQKMNTDSNKKQELTDEKQSEHDSKNE